MSNYHSLGPNVPDAVEQKQSANTIGRHYCGFKRESLNAQFRHTCLGCWRPSLSLAEFPVVQCLEKSNSSHQIFWLKSNVYSYHFPQQHRNKHHITMVFFPYPWLDHYDIVRHDNRRYATHLDLRLSIAGGTRGTWIGGSWQEGSRSIKILRCLWTSGAFIFKNDFNICFGP